MLAVKWDKDSEPGNRFRLFSQESALTAAMDDRSQDICVAACISDGSDRSV